jgi:signal transduction histidine kinase
LNNKLKPKYSAIEYAVHDIRGLIHPVVYHTDCLIQDWEILTDAERKNYIYFISKASKRLRKFTDVLLDLSKIKSGSIGFDFQTVDLLQLIIEIIDEYKNLDLAQLPIEIELKIPNVLQGLVHGDLIRLSQLLLNLLSNAAKFSKRGKIEVAFSEIVENDRVFWCTAISDQGPGIKIEELENIFEPFVRNKNNHDGSGLGLAICKEIVHAHHGRIWAESDGKSGTIFYFILPKITNIG